MVLAAEGLSVGFDDLKSDVGERRGCGIPGCDWALCTGEEARISGEAARVLAAERPLRGGDMVWLKGWGAGPFIVLRTTERRTYVEAAVDSRMVAPGPWTQDVCLAHLNGKPVSELELAKADDFPAGALTMDPPPALPKPPAPPPPPAPPAAPAPPPKPPGPVGGETAWLRGWQRGPFLVRPVAEEGFVNLFGLDGRLVENIAPHGQSRVPWSLLTTEPPPAPPPSPWTPLLLVRLLTATAVIAFAAAAWAVA